LALQICPVSHKHLCDLATQTPNILQVHL